MRLITPGDDAGIDGAFADIETLAAACRFNDCTHAREPGCAVRAAVAQGVLSEERLEGYAKLRREMAHMERKDDPRVASETRKRWASIHKAAKTHMKQKRSGWD